jgi:hypothetical protein
MRLGMSPSGTTRSESSDVGSTLGIADRSAYV